VPNELDWEYPAS